MLTSIAPTEGLRVNIGRIPAKTASLEPQREALVDVPNERRITFGELDERVRRLANALRDDLGLSKGDRVAILSKNCIQYMEVFYGAARCGLIALPLNWRLSDVELLRLLEDGEPRVIVVSAEYREMAERLRQKIHIDHWFIFEDQPEDNYERLIAAASSDEPAAAAQVSADDPVLILYTGGTTGLSKGALHTHHSLYMGMIN
ncbi:MAG: AMP-binding protein, partial [Halieaceae bacterium]|nr:AMP-binding protein [Halieaceae bacterium]